MTVQGRRVRGRRLHAKASAAAAVDPLTAALAAALLSIVGAGVLLASTPRGRLAWRRAATRDAAPTDRLTGTWRLAELGAPWVVGHDVDCDVPAGSRVVASGRVEAEVLAACEVRMAPRVAAEFAVRPDGAAALLFLGGLRAGSQAVVSRDGALGRRLAADAQALWERSEPYLERGRLADVARRFGVPVETQGIALDSLPRAGGHLVRLEDEGQVVAVAVDRPAEELKGQRLLVRGRMERDASGYPVLRAVDVRRLQ